jgi:hypothetical protein
VGSPHAGLCRLQYPCNFGIFVTKIVTEVTKNFHTHHYLVLVQAYK